MLTLAEAISRLRGQNPNNPAKPAVEAVLEEINSYEPVPDQVPESA